MTTDERYADAYYQSAEWLDRVNRHADNIAARDAAQAARVDPASADAFAQLIADKLRSTPALGAYRAPTDGEPDHPLADYLIDWAQFWAADLDATDWILEPLFADGRAHALYAGAKTGKSYLVLAACAAMATGQAFLNQPAGPPVHVLYVDYEMTPQDVRERLEEFGYGPDSDLSHLHYALLPSLPPLDTPEGGMALLQAARAVRARFVVIDTMARAVTGEENDGDTFRAFYMWTGKALKQAGIGWVRLDHAGKDPVKGQRGSSAKNDDVDIVCRLERVDGGQRLIATHRRMSWYPERTDIAVAEQNGVMRFTTPEGEMWPAGTGELAADLDRIGVPLDASRRTARAAMDEAGLTGSNTVLGKALKWRRVEAARKAAEQFDELADDFLSRHAPRSDHREETQKWSTDHFIHRPGTENADHDGQSPEPAETKADHPADQRGPAVDANADHPASHVVDAGSAAWPSDESAGDDGLTREDSDDEIPDPFAATPDDTQETP